MARSVLVTGGGRGIGWCVARAFADAGDRVAVTVRTSEAPRGMLAIRCDVRDRGQVEDAFDRVEREQGPVDVLVSNAGITMDRLLALMSEDEFNEVLSVNLGGAFNVTRRAVRGMLARRSGRIILIASTSGLRGAPGQANYAASKAAQVGLARSLARELGPRGITVNVVAPGLIETDMTAALPEQRRAEMLAPVPLGRAGHGAEVAAAVRFLAGADAGYITGAVLPVDGGVGMGH